jgi:hypothetical protein
VLHHPWSITSKDPPNCEDAGCHPSQSQGGRGAHSASDGMSTAMEWVLECSSSEASRVEAMGKLATKF